MKAFAIKRHIRSSPRKMRLVVDMIRGKKAQDALTILKFDSHFAAKDAEMVLRSALGNLQVKADKDGVRLRDNEIIISEVQVNQGPTMKRISPAPMGRAYRIRKRSNHLQIVVQTKDHKEQE